MENSLPAIPAKRYFTIGEVGDLCGVKPHVLRYWEQEFTQLRPVKRRGNRRYYQHHEVLMIRRIRELLYEQGFTISGARNRLQEASMSLHENAANGAETPDTFRSRPGSISNSVPLVHQRGTVTAEAATTVFGADAMRQELFALKHLLTIEAV